MRLRHIWILLAFSSTLVFGLACAGSAAGGASASSGPSESPSTSAAETLPADVAPAPDLTAGELLDIVRATYTSYPWRMTSSVVVQETGETVTSLVEASAPSSVHTQAVQSIEGVPITLDAILIGDDLYMKGTGGPPEAYALFGAVEGQWMAVPPDHEFYEYAELARLAADPTALLDVLAGEGLGALLSGAGEQVLSPGGSESVFGVTTNIYEYAGPFVTYRWWIGPDRRFYRLTTDSDAGTTTIDIEYDSTIDVQPPM